MKGERKMHRQRLSKQVVWAILIMLLLVGCGAPIATSTPIPPTDIPTPTSVFLPETDARIEVTFHGESCDVTSPEVLPVGKYVFVLKDLDRTTSATLYISRLTDGHTYQDLLEPQDAPGDYYPKPDWVVYALKIGHPTNSSGETTYDVTLEAGEHAIYVSNWLPTSEWGLWFCAPLMVVEPSSD
jgi:hypothetical protein